MTSERSGSVVERLTRDQGAAGIQSISTPLTKWLNFGSSLVDGESEKEHLKTLLLGS